MFLVCGEALFDLFTSAVAGAPSRIRLDGIAGGSPFNVAIGLARLGAPAALLTGLSSDGFGRQLGALLREEGVATRYLAHFDAPTTLAMVGVSPDGSPVYSFRGEGCADRLLRPEHLVPLADDISALHVGSYSLVVPPVADTLFSLVERERHARLISLDPNVRLTVEPDIGRWRDRVEAIARRAHLVKVSEEDLALLYPSSAPEAVAESWLSERCELVLLTRGSQGASAFSARHGALHVAATPVAVCDTVGAGDTFQAATLAWLHERGLASIRGLGRLSRRDLQELLAFGVAAAAITCSRSGPDLPRRAELQAFAANGG